MAVRHDCAVLCYGSMTMLCAVIMNGAAVNMLLTVMT